MAMSGIGTIACAVAYLVPLILLIGSSRMDYCVSASGYSYLDLYLMGLISARGIGLLHLAGPCACGKVCESFVRTTTDRQ